MLVQRILRMQRIISIESQSWPIGIEEFILDFEHAGTIADMPPIWGKSRIQHLIVHTFEGLHLMIKRRIGNIVSVEKMRKHSFDDEIRMALKLIDQIR